MIITTAKLLHSTILKMFLVLSLVIISLFFVLTSGVTIPNISLPGLKISQFYIKLDKKLDISVDSIEIEKRNEPTKTVKELERVGTLVQYLPNYFDRVYIKNLIVGDRVFHLLYSDDVFYFDADSLQISSKIAYDPSRKVLKANIRKLLIKDPGIEVRGTFIYDFKNKIWRGEGRYGGLGLEGDFNVSQRKDYVTFKIDSKPCNSIKALVDYIAPPEEIKVWIYPKIPAKRYVLHYIEGRFKIDSEGEIKFDPKELEASATAYGAKVHFHEGVPPVEVEKIDVTLKKDTISFKLHKPVYEGKRLDGSRVKIRDLTTIKAELDAHIVVKDKIDDSIKRVLDAYGIHLPFIQTEGVTDAVVDLSVALATGKLLKYEGEYKSEYAKLLFDNVVPLPVRGLHVVSKGSKIEILPCQVEFEPYLDANLSGSIDLHKNRGDFYPLVKKLEYDYHNVPLFGMNETKEHLILDFTKDVLFSVPKLAIEVIYKKGGGLDVKALELKLLKPYFQGPLKPVEKGKLHLSYTKNRILARADIKYPNDIFKNQNENIDFFKIEADSKEGQTHVRINDTISIVAQDERTFFNIKKIDIAVDKLLESIKRYTKESKAEEVKEVKQDHLLYIEGHESKLSYKKVQLPSRFYNIQMHTEPFGIKFETVHEKGKIRGIVDKKELNIAGKDLSDKMMRKLTTIDQLEGGSFDFNAVGKIEDFNGTILMRDTLWTKTAFYNNLLATLNTIPAILTLKDPGFSKNGFKIKRGAFDYRFKDGRLFFKKIVIEGYSAQITGKGSIDFNTGMVALKLQIHFMESLTNVLSKIPVAGYIIFGKDGTLAVTLNVKGPLENPKVETEATKDIIKAPLNILERTLTLPFKLFE